MGTFVNGESHPEAETNWSATNRLEFGARASAYFIFHRGAGPPSNTARRSFLSHISGIHISQEPPTLEVNAVPWKRRQAEYHRGTRRDSVDHARRDVAADPIRARLLFLKEEDGKLRLQRDEMPKASPCSMTSPCRTRFLEESLRSQLGNFF